MKSKSLFTNSLKDNFLLIFSLLSIFFIVEGCKKNSVNSGSGGGGASSVKTINSFEFSVSKNPTFLSSTITGNVGNDTIFLELDYGTIITSLIPTITYTGKRLTPNIDLPQNFNNPINYIVTAEDGSTKSYITKVVYKSNNQRVYFGSDDKNLYCLNAVTGDIIWKYLTGGSVRSTPSYSNNTIYFGSNDRYIYALEATTGLLKWRYSAPSSFGFSSPVVVNGVLYIATTGWIIAINSLTGALIWQKNYGTIPFEYVKVFGDKIFINTWNGGGVQAFSIATGDRIWANSGVGVCTANPAVYNGKLYVSGESYFYCLNPDDGSIVWRTPSIRGYDSPTIDNGKIYSGSNSNSLKSFDAVSGNQLWVFDGTIYGQFSSPIAFQNNVLTGNSDGYIYCFSNETGILKWRFATGASTSSTLRANINASNNVAFCGSQDTYFYALDVPTGTLKWRFKTDGPTYSGSSILTNDNKAFTSGISGERD